MRPLLVPALSMFASPVLASDIDKLIGIWLSSKSGTWLPAACR